MLLILSSLVIIIMWLGLRKSNILNNFLVILSKLVNTQSWWNLQNVGLSQIQSQIIIIIIKMTRTLYLGSRCCSWNVFQPWSNFLGTGRLWTACSCSSWPTCSVFGWDCSLVDNSLLEQSTHSNTLQGHRKMGTWGWILANLM